MYINTATVHWHDQTKSGSASFSEAREAIYYLETFGDIFEIVLSEEDAANTHPITSIAVESYKTYTDDPDHKYQVPISANTDCGFNVRIEEQNRTTRYTIHLDGLVKDIMVG